MTQQPPLVSVVMPCFDVDVEHLDEALASVRAQSYEPIEIIVVDDGSTEPRLLGRLAELEESRSITLVRQDNQGPAAARNAAVAASRGTYVLPVDCDDRIAPDYAEKAVAFLEAHTETAMVYGEGEYFGARSGRIEVGPYSERTMLTDNMIFNSAVYRRDAFDRVGGYNPRMRHGLEDHEFWLRLCAASGPPHKLSDTVLYYRIRENSRNSDMIHDRDGYVAAMAEMFRVNHEIYARHPDLLFRLIEDARAEVLYWAGRYGPLDRTICRVPSLERALHRVRRGKVFRALGRRR